MAGGGVSSPLHSVTVAKVPSRSNTTTTLATSRNPSVDMVQVTVRESPPAVSVRRWLGSPSSAVQLVNDRSERLIRSRAADIFCAFPTDQVLPWASIRSRGPSHHEE